MIKFSAIIFIFISFIFIVLPVHAYDPLSVQNNIYGIGVINHSDLSDVSNLVNVNGGDWGYVKVIITEKDRNKETWQKFLDDCRKLHLIPIIRVASSYDGENWTIPTIDNIDSWVNFFNSLNWVVENRYIIIGNEPNHAKEWGGIINPAEYAIYLKTFSERLHNASTDYFVLNAGFDQAAPNGKETMDEMKFINGMEKEIPDIFKFIDGWNSHSYPNPAFSGPKTGNGKKSIRGYEWELQTIKRDLPIFITETGWVRQTVKDQQLTADNLKYAFENVWVKDKRIVAVTPFILNYQSDPFYEFSWKNKDGSYFPIYSEIQNLQKIKGEPPQRVSGEVIFNFLNPLMINSNETKGLSVVRNTGQNIWNSKNIEIKVEKGELEVKQIELNDVQPFTSGLVVYSLKTSDQKNIFDTKVGFYVQEKRIGDLYNGKIISF